MVASRRKRKRGKAMIIFLLPALAFIFLIGWCMYCIGDQKKPDKIKRKPRKKNEDGVTIMPMIYEETPEIINK